MAFIFENLSVYQESLNFAETISKLTDTFPRGSFYVRDQLNRAATSIVLNSAERNGRYTRNDRNNFFYNARGSVHECVPLLELTCRKGLIEPENKKKLNDQLESIAKMISGLIK